MVISLLHLNSLNSLETTLQEMQQVIAIANLENVINREEIIIAFDQVIAKLENLLVENPGLVKFFLQPSSLYQLGISYESIATAEELLQSPKIKEMLGLPVEANSGF